MAARYGVRVCLTDYTAFFEEADARAKAGEHQHQCGMCLRWYWPLHTEEHEHKHGHRPKPTGLEFPRRRFSKNRCTDCDRRDADRAKRIEESRR
mgnify:CR=1 FL=1